MQATYGDAPIPVDLVTTSASGLDPDISPAAAQYQVAPVAKARGMSEADVQAAVARHTEPAVAGLPRPAPGERPAAQPRPRRAPGSEPIRSGTRSTSGRRRTRCSRASGPRRPADAAGCGSTSGMAPGRRQDVPDARGGPPAGRSRDRPRRRLRRGARPGAHARPARRARGRAPAPDRVPRRRRRGDGHRRGDRPPAHRRPHRRAGPHEHPRLAAGEALGGRRDHPRRRDPRRQHHATSSTSRASPTPSRRSPGRRSTSACPTTSSLGGRRDRARRHEPARPSPADAARQRLPARADPGRPREVLHRGAT